MIEYRKGNLFEAPEIEAGDSVVIPHVCNNIGGWGAGFVLAVSRFSKEPEKQYREANLVLGQVQLVKTKHETWVANMCAQDGITSDSTGDREKVCDRPLKYNVLSRCMDGLAGMLLSETKIICPKFGSALAGGNWSFIEELINDCWLERGIQVTVYEF